VRVEISFREGRPAADMTREEVITWLLGSTGTMSAGAGLASCWLTAAMVDGMKEGRAVAVEVPGGEYLLTVTIVRRWFRRPVRTYHAEESS
jgi:diaminopimelate epimerase